MNRDNQQEIPTEAEIAWLGGIIEGEGSVSLSCYVRNEKSKPKMGTPKSLSWPSKISTCPPPLGR